MPGHTTSVFNPKILDASVRDVAVCLSENDKADLVLYAVRKLNPDNGRIKTVIENAIQSCLNVATLSLESKAKARVIRARARLANGAHLSGMEDLQAALIADPDNVEAKAMLHARTQTLDKLLTPATFAPTAAGSPASTLDGDGVPTSSTGSPYHLHPYNKQLERISIEIWREVALFLPRRDLKALLFVPHILSRVASQLLFRELDLHFTGGEGSSYSGYGYGYGAGGESDDDDTVGPSSHARDRVGDLDYRERGLDAYGRERDADGYRLERDEGRHAQRTADILTRLIVDQKFANAVRTMRIYCSARRDRDGSMAFQTGMLTNVLPKLVNLKNIYLSAPSESIVPVLRILQTTGTRLHGLSLHSPDAPADLSFLELRNLSHFAYTTSGGTLSCITPLLSLSRTSLSSLSLENTAHGSPSPHWTFPVTYVSIRNLTSLNFTGHFTKDHGAGIMGEILRDGKQLESLSVICCALECAGMSREFKNAGVGWAPGPPGGGGGMMQSVSMNSNGTPVALPFLRNFAFTITSIGRRVVDRELFPSIADFLRGRRSLKSLKMRVDGDEHTQSAVGFSAAVWGVLPSLEALRGLAVTYPSDLSPGLASWLVPRSVRALTLFLDYAGHATGRDPGVFLASLRQGMPPDLRFIGLSELNVRHASVVVEQGFPTVRVVRVGQNYWTVHHRSYGSGYGGIDPSAPQPLTSRTLLPSVTSHRGTPVDLSGPGNAGPTSATNTPRGTLSPSARAERGGDRDQRASSSLNPPPSSIPSSNAVASGSGRGGNERPLHMLRTLTHTGHPHSGHTHGHPGSSNPHPPHGHSHILNPVPSASGHGHGEGSNRAGPSGYASTSGIPGGYGAASSSSGHHPHQSMGPPLTSSHASSSSHAPSSGLMSSGILIGPGGQHGHGHVGGAIMGAAGSHGTGAMLEMEMWPRRRVVYHVAEWLEWLGCEDALVRDHGAFPAWTMVL